MKEEDNILTNKKRPSISVYEFKLIGKKFDILLTYIYIYF